MLLKLIREPNNPYNKYAVKVVTRLINEVREDFLKVEISPYLKRQVVRDILNKTV